MGKLNDEYNEVSDVEKKSFILKTILVTHFLKIIFMKICLWNI